ncbi:hypothetical protein IA823_12945 [Listeria welshimeri]|uniref:IS630 transposase-related protein n=1 Tax=Listeria welshimeri TaxID=1643 RepID=UPI001887B7E8|nr:IS630 transposase-related protein [Listeria welshimeri]MBF2413543.1 hypothetical protein [Listeria welshimeri]
MGSKEKTREIVNYIFNNPNKSIAELAKHFDMTRQGIHLIIQKNSDLRNQRLKIKKQEEIKLAGDIQMYIKKNPEVSIPRILENASDRRISKSTLLRIVEKYDISLNKSIKVDDVIINQMIRYMEEYPMKKQKEIADRFNLSESYVGLLIQKFNMPYNLKRKQKIYLKASELALYVKEHPEKTYQEIANKFNVSKESVINQIKRNNISYVSKLKKEKKEIDINALRTFINDNPELSVKRIAKHFNVAEATINMRIKKYEIQYKAKRNKNKP